MKVLKHGSDTKRARVGATQHHGLVLYDDASSRCGRLGLDSTHETWDIRESCKPMREAGPPKPSRSRCCYFRLPAVETCRNRQLRSVMTSSFLMDSMRTRPISPTAAVKIYVSNATDRTIPTIEEMLVDVHRSALKKDKSCLVLAYVFGQGYRSAVQDIKHWQQLSHDRTSLHLSSTIYRRARHSESSQREYRPRDARCFRRCRQSLYAGGD